MSVKLEFWEGNPSVGIRCGLLLIEPEFHVPDPHRAPLSMMASVLVESAGSAVSSSPTVVVCPTVPSDMPPAEFMEYLRASHSGINRAKVLHGTDVEHYIIALLFDTYDAAARCTESMSGRRFNSLESTCCSLHLLEAVDIDGGGPVSPCRLFDPPLVNDSACPICLEAYHPREGLDEAEVCRRNPKTDCKDREPECLSSVPVTTLCGHTFHFQCLLRWVDQSCPICRYYQHPGRVSGCEDCGESHVERLRLCLVCGRISCGPRHSTQHFEASQHAYALDIHSQRAWSFSGGCYVDRMLLNAADGKLVEFSRPSPEPQPLPSFLEEATEEAESEGGSKVEGKGGKPAKSKGRAESLVVSMEQWVLIVSEFNSILSSQLEEQKRFYDLRLQGKRSEEKARLDSIEEEILRVERGVEKEKVNMQEEVESLRREGLKLSSLEVSLSRRKSVLESLFSKLSASMSSEGKEEAEKKKREELRREKDDLRDQIRDLEGFLKMKGKLEKEAKKGDATNVVGSSMVVAEKNTKRKKK